MGPHVAGVTQNLYSRVGVLWIAIGMVKVSLLENKIVGAANLHRTHQVFLALRAAPLGVHQGFFATLAMIACIESALHAGTAFPIRRAARCAANCVPASCWIMASRLLAAPNSCCMASSSAIISPSVTVRGSSARS